MIHLRAGITIAARLTTAMEISVVILPELPNPGPLRPGIPMIFGCMPLAVAEAGVMDQEALA
jgi:hypothetical protein